MNQGAERRSGDETPLAQLAGALLRISEDLDLRIVLQEVVDGSRSLTGAECGAIATFDEAGHLQELVSSGKTPEGHQELLAFPDRDALFRHLSALRRPLRTGDFAALASAAGFPGLQPSLGAVLVVPIRVRDRPLGSICVSEKEGGVEFTREDETVLEMFAAQAAMAITNARRYGDSQRANADLEALVDTSPVGVLVFEGATRRLVKFNREACRIVGYPPGHLHDLARLLDQLTFRRMDGSVVERADLPLERAALTGETVRAEEIIIELPDGKQVTTLVNATPIRADDTDTESIVATLQDITPLEELERLRAEFLGIVSHELRAPLTAIKGSAATAQQASRPLDPAETQQFFRIIEEQADHMRDLINDLLDLTRIEAGVLSVSPEPSDLAAAIDQAKNAFASGGYRTSITVDLAPGLPRVWADKQRVVQVLHNLFSNAAKHSRQWSTITVTAQPQELHVAVSVTDEGEGIDAQRLPYLFTKFATLDSSGSGHGLGLTICKGVIEAHGGRIWAHSDGPGHGTRLTFTLPAVDETVPSAAETDTTDVRPAPSRLERIVAIDDDTQTLRYIRSTLADAGYSPVLTSDPAEVDHLLTAEQPDLVLLNLVLPGTDGFELLRHIPNISDASIIILSGRGRDQDVARAFDMGAADYVVKPFSPSELRARITAALRRRALTQQTEPYRLGDLAVDYMARTVTLAGRPLKLTPTEYKLFFELFGNTGRVLTYDQLVERVWGAGSSADAQRVRMFVKDLRRKLGDNARRPSYILTVPGVGYRAATASPPS